MSQRKWPRSEHVLPVIANEDRHEDKHTSSQSRELNVAADTVQVPYRFALFLYAIAPTGWTGRTWFAFGNTSAFPILVGAMVSGPAVWSIIWFAHRRTSHRRSTSMKTMSQPDVGGGQKKEQPKQANVRNDPATQAQLHSFCKVQVVFRLHKLTHAHASRSTIVV
jgi:hypothetical protein